MLYASLTCLPTRIDNIKYVLESIENQTLQPDFIIIHYPKKCIRLGIEYNIEEFRSKISTSSLMPKIILNETVDYGPITKIYPLVHMQNLKDDDIIIVIDDDVFYNRLLFQALHQHFIMTNKKKSICISGLLYPTELNSRYNCVCPGGKCSLMEAAFGYIIEKSFIQPDLSNWVITAETVDEVEQQNFMNSFLSDDYVISRYFDVKNIEKQVLFFTPHINKMNTMCDSECKSTNALSGLELNLNKYVRAEQELTSRHLV